KVVIYTISSRGTTVPGGTSLNSFSPFALTTSISLKASVVNTIAPDCANAAVAKNIAERIMWRLSIWISSLINRDVKNKRKHSPRRNTDLTVLVLPQIDGDRIRSRNIEIGEINGRIVGIGLRHAVQPDAAWRVCCIG